MKSKIIKISTSLVMCSLASQVFASGFQLLEQNVTNLGLAYSGTAALAEDATTGFFNPAGLTRIPNSEVVISGILIQGDFDFDSTRATSSFGTTLSNSNVLPNGSDDPARLAGVPTLNIAKRLDEHWVLGFNVNVPFGLVSKYDNSGVARYIATTSELQTMNLSPSIGFQAWPCLSFGLGVDALYGKARLDTATGNGDPGLDGFVRNEADGWGYGWHAGVLWDYRGTTRIGINYRSKVNLHANGYSEILTGAALTPIGVNDMYFIRSVDAKVVLPETATFSFYQELAAFKATLDKFALTGDIAWTNWSRFHTLRLRTNPPVQFSPLAVTNLDSDKWANFKDSRRYALGLLYKHAPQWTFSVGVAYDETPTRDEFRSARIPDDNRYWVAIGAAYTHNQNWRFDAGYAHLFFDNPSINETAPFGQGSNQPLNNATLAGNYSPSANLFGVQMRYDFA